MAENPSLSLLILDSCSLWNSCTTSSFHIQVGFTVFMLAFSCWGSRMLSSPILAWGFMGVDVSPHFGQLWSTHGWDDVSPMWLPKPTHPQKGLSCDQNVLWLSGQLYNNQHHVWCPLCQQYIKCLFGQFHLARMEVVECEASGSHYSGVSGTSPRWFCCLSSRVDKCLIALNYALVFIGLLKM